MDYVAHDKNEVKPPIELMEIHSSWITDIPNGKLLDKLRKGSSFESKLMELISEHIDIEDIDINHSDGLLKKLHIKTPDELQEIVLKAGAAQLSKEIRLTIKKRDVIKVRDFLGEDLYNFSLHIAPITFPTAQVEPEQLTKDQKTIIQIIDHGYHSLRVVLQMFPNNCFLKLPKQWDNNYPDKKLDIIDRKEYEVHTTLISQLA